MNEDSFELAVECSITAPPALVWQIMTDRLTEWWCPKPWRTEIEAIEWHAGGRFAGMMRGPNPGEESPMNGVFLEVTPGKRFVFTDAFAAGWTPQGPFMVGIFAIRAEGAGTYYRAAARHWTEKACKTHAEMGFAEGWGVCAGQLKALCEAG
jgi:uncharacterized protein YndB with AHSA1/START domain